MATAPQVSPDATPKMTYRSKRAFEMREVKFGEDVETAINKWVYSQIEARKKQLEILYKQKVPEWRRIASGKPLEENKSWPFPNCANLVHQIVGQSIDDISARVLGLVFATSPTAIYRYFTKSKDPKESERNAEKARTLEQFIDYASLEPTELNLYEVENLWFTDGARLGTSFVCVHPEKRLESVYVGYEDKKSKFEEDTLYEGPKCSVLRFEDVGYDPNANSLDDSDIVWRKATLTRRDLQERVFKGHYRKEAVESLFGKPDRYGPNEIKRRENQKKGISTVEERVLAEWDIYECYFYWYHNDKKFRLMCWYHFETKTVMNLVFNPIPDNQIPIVRTRLSIDNHGMLGTGYAEMLKDAQDEISTAKNQRTDAITWSIMGINTVNPQNKNIDRNLVLFPGVSLPLAKDDFMHYSTGEASMGALSLQNEQAMIQQAMERAGVGPAIAGMGSGGPNKKGQYGSMGTLAVLQDNNTRANHRTSDFRHSHVKLIGLLTSFYGALGLGKKGSLFGLDDELLSEALSDYLEHRVRIPIRAATASANSEVRKQNDMLLMQALRQHTAGQTQLLQAIANASVPPEVKQYLMDSLKSQTRLMKQTMRSFQYDQPEEFVPEVNMEKPNAQAPDPRIIEMAKTIQRPGAGNGTPVVPGVAQSGAGLPEQSGNAG